MQVNDLIPLSSGLASLGVNQSFGDSFDATDIRPFNHIHMISGIFHDSLAGQSGCIRYSKAANAFQVSVDGGLTFNNIATGGTVVTSIGVINGANLTGDVDLAPTASGFINITDNAGATPISFSLDVWGLSGLYGFKSTGFSNMGRMAAQTFSAAFIWTFTHNLGTTDVLVQAYDNGSPRNQIIPDDVKITNSNTVTLNFNPAQAGRAICIGF